ncbi:MAG: tandem-95 repeat protein [Caldilineaceae bacterium]|nr:tandem-95 repeat protein [Caldilineaceae bacterium]
MNTKTRNQRSYRPKSYFAIRLLPVVILVLLAGLSFRPAFADDPGSALEFDGVNDYVRLERANTLMGGTSWASTKTINVWIKPAGTTSPSVTPQTGQIIVGNDSPRSFGITRATNGGGDKLWVWNSDSNGIDRIGIDFTPNEWVNIALVHDGVTLYAYKNGTMVGSTASGPTLINGNSGDGMMFLGGSGRSGTTTYFAGQLDEVRFWNVALGQPAIADWMTRTVTNAHPNWANLSAYYQMSNGSGTSLTDDSGHGHSGTLFGGMSNANWVASTAFPASTPEPNETPVANAQTVSLDEDTSINITLTGSDLDNDPLTYSIVDQPTKGALSGSAPNLTYTPAANRNGSDSFTFVVNDGRVNSATALVTITINPLNDAPVAVDDTASTAEDMPVTIHVLANDTDVDGDTLTVTSVGAASNGTVTHDTSSVTYTPNPGHVGSDSFSYTLDDGNGGTATAQVQVTITEQNDPPQALDDTGVTDEDTPVTIAVLANDSDPDDDELTVSAVSPAANGSVAIVGSEVTYTPNANFNGADLFGYTVSDGHGGEASANVAITIHPINDAPVATNDTFSINVATQNSLLVLENDSDVDGDTLTILAVGTGSQGTTAISGDEITYTPNSGFSNSDSFSYTIGDGHGGTSTAQVTVNAITSANAGYALAFDGSNDYVRLPKTQEIFGNGWEASHSVSLWVKPTAPAEVVNNSVAWCDSILGDRPRWWGISHCNFKGSDRIWFWNYDGNFDLIGVPYSMNQWVHITLVQDGNLFSAYRNGVLMGSMASGPTLQPNTGGQPVLQIGAVINNADRNWSFKGEIDEVSLWNIPVSASQIQANMFVLLSGNETGLAAYYQMSNGSGTVVTDNSVNSWDGIIQDGLLPSVPPDGLATWIPSGAFNQQASVAQAMEANDTLILSIEGPPPSEVDDLEEDGSEEDNSEQPVKLFLPGITAGPTVQPNGTVIFSMEGPPPSEVDSPGD